MRLSRVARGHRRRERLPLAPAVGERAQCYRLIGTTVLSSNPSTFTSSDPDGMMNLAC